MGAPLGALQRPNRRGAAPGDGVSPIVVRDPSREIGQDFGEVSGSTVESMVATVLALQRPSRGGDGTLAGYPP